MKRRWGITARKSPIGSTNNQRGMKNPPLIEVSLYKANAHFIAVLQNGSYYDSKN
ncbi:hypothetical protein [Bacillus sp. FJAT-27225]|uniref:hypothetical protein n=1 Tax=Bacillus sp. FJAT-27225 TaxID=1743144 RepID=UPI000ACAB840|nr:hypothetical protein [Bacillus sp. FJAT-27225]